MREPVKHCWPLCGGAEKDILLMDGNSATTPLKVDMLVCLRGFLSSSRHDGVSVYLHAVPCGSLDELCSFCSRVVSYVVVRKEGRDLDRACLFGRAPRGRRPLHLHLHPRLLFFFSFSMNNETNISYHIISYHNDYIMLIITVNPFPRYPLRSIGSLLACHNEMQLANN